MFNKTLFNKTLFIKTERYTMSPVMERLTDAQDRFIEAVDSARDPMVKGVRRVAEWVDERFADRELPSLPFADKVPSAIELAENQHRFFARLNDTSHELVAAVIAAGAVSDAPVSAATQSKTNTKPKVDKAPARAA